MISKAGKFLEEFDIDNPNSSGQGHSDSHKDNPYHKLLTEFGFKYSHSTPITKMDGSKYIHHTYKNKYNVGVFQQKEDGSWLWDASPSSASGYQMHGNSEKRLRNYLSNLKKRKKIS